MVQGVIITGGEDSQVLAWSMQEHPRDERGSSIEEISKTRKDKEREDRYFKPY